ncbi:MAG: T9SS type A sorting domain-containing protein [Ignavibacteria bacterium]|nr:T9SS type A sorting domain-containing protein [Ignavibacteria bacterium]
MIQSFDGESWKLHPVPETFDGGHYSELWGLTCLTDSRIYAVGLFRPVGSYDRRTLVMHNDIVSGISGEENSFSPTQFTLYQNYPNPFNPITVIRFQLPMTGKVTLKVYDIAGTEIATLVDEERTAGNYEVSFNGSSLSSGTYFYRLSAGNPSTDQGFVETRKMILLK